MIAAQWQMALLEPPAPGTARCRKCLADKTAAEFATDARKRNGLSSWCKNCHAAATKRWAKRNPEKAHATRGRPEALSREQERERARYRSPGGWERRQLLQIRYRAKRDGIPFDLTVEDLRIPTYCPVLGILLRPGDGMVRDHSPSVDRIDPSLGYVRGNVAVISWRANSLKKNASTAEVERLLSWMREVQAP